MSRPSSLGSRLALLLFGLFLAGATGEILLRAVGHSGNHWVRPLDADTTGLPVFTNIFEVLRPNVRGQFMRRLYESNSAGLRGPEVAIPKPEGTFRIAMVGD